MKKTIKPKSIFIPSVLMMLPLLGFLGWLMVVLPNAVVKNEGSIGIGTVIFEVILFVFFSFMAYNTIMVLLHLINFRIRFDNESIEMVTHLGKKNFFKWDEIQGIKHLRKGKVQVLLTDSTSVKINGNMVDLGSFYLAYSDIKSKKKN